MSASYPHSIRKRFLVTFLNNILRAGVSFLAVILLARWLGPEDYGRLSFILVSLLAFKGLLGMGSEEAFVTFASQRRRSRKFINTYWIWVFVQLVIAISIVAFIIPDIELKHLWKGEDRFLIVLGLIAVFAQNLVWTTALAMAEAQRQTIPAQKINTAVVLIHLCVVVLLWIFGKLAIPFLFIAIAVEWSLAGWFTSRLYSINKDVEEDESFLKILSEYKIFCLPLIPYAWLGFIHNFADRWMLQHWGGSEEQAYFSIARQFSIVTLLVATSILNIFWKEISEAHYQVNKEKVTDLFAKVHHLLYLFGVLVASFIFPWSKEILVLIVGQEYIAGEITFMLMILYPVYQILGQIGGVMLLATHQTRLSTLIGGFAMILGLIVSYFMMAPPEAFISGLGLASKGLAWKMLLVQFIQINILFWFISRLFKVKLEWKFQIISLIVALGLSWTIKILIVNLLSIPTIFSVIIFGFLYLLLAITLLYFFPSIVGWERKELNDFVSSVSRITKIGNG